VVAIFSHILLQGRAPVVFGRGTPTRDYVHVTDVALALEAASGAGGTYNIATGIETPVSTILAMLQEAAGTSIEPQLAPLREGELTRSCMDPSRAARDLGWTAGVDLHEGIAATFESFASAAVS
jgi:UDP-glucose 4-epimerase